MLIVLYIKNTTMKFAGWLIKSGLTVAGAGIYLLVRRFFRKVKKTTKDRLEKVEAKLEKKSTPELPAENANMYLPIV